MHVGLEAVGGQQAAHKNTQRIERLIRQCTPSSAEQTVSWGLREQVLLCTVMDCTTALVA
jgi:hypothetical protein